jgi:hypothetical protein
MAFSDPSGIADLIGAASVGPQGPQDAAWHTGTIVSWDNTTMLNVVRVNGVLLSNLKALQGGIGLSYAPGDTVMVVRKQSQYFILGKVGTPGGTGVVGSAPSYSLEGGGPLTGSTDSWRDLDSGLSPSVTVRIGGNALVMFGVDYLVTQNSMVEVSITLSGATNFSPGLFTGMTFTCAHNNGSNGGGYTINSPSSSLMLFKNTGIAPNYFTPGVTTFSLKYKLNIFNDGTQVFVSAPWITVIPF